MRLTRMMVLGILLLWLSAFGVQNPVDYILWSPERPLSWTDFKATTVSARPGVCAVSHLQLFPSYSYNKNGVKYGVECRFIPSKSWVNETGRASAVLLKHEQGHFDLAEYYARVLRLSLHRSKLTPQNIRDRVLQFRDSVSTVEDARQELYDQETELGRSADRQIDWEQAIKRDLKSLEEYSLER